MKKLFRFAILSLAVTALWSCNDDIDYVDNGLDVNPNNLSGAWYIAEWNGQPMAEGTFVYIEFTRKDKEYTMYQNLDSFTTRKITGNYNLDSDAEYGPFILGVYDYDNGDWQHRYLIRDLNKESMTWIAMDDHNEIQVFKRIDKIPDNIINGTDL